MREVTIQFPDVKPIKGIIQKIDLVNSEYKPFFVKFDSGLQITDFRWVEKEWVGEAVEEYQRPYKEDWVHIDFITDIRFESDKQIEIKF